MHEYPLIGWLVVVLKQFLIYHNLLESFNGGISSYCLILLILSYLQVHTRLSACLSLPTCLRAAVSSSGESSMYEVAEL